MGGGISKEFYSTIQIIKILFNQDIFTATLKTVKESYIITIQNDYPDKQTIICTYNGKEYTNGSFTAKYGTTITAKLKPYVYPKGSLGYGCDWSVANLNKESYTVIDDFTFTASEPLLSIDNFCYNIPNYKTTETLSDDQLTWLSNKKIGKINGLFGDKDTVTGHEAMPKLKTIPKLGLDTSYCIEFTHLIYACVSLISFDCSWIKTDNAISFFHMFCTYNTPLETLDCSGWNTSKVTNMQDCFANLSMTKIINITGWDTSNVVNMQTAFAVGRDVLGINNVKLEKIIGVIDMKSCTKYYRMFYSAPKLKGVKIKNPPFDPQNANAKKKFEMVAGIEANQYVIVD